MGPGLRVGRVAPGRYYDKVIAAKLGSTYASPTLMQVAVAEFLKNGGYERHLRAMRKSCGERLHVHRSAILESFPSEVRVSNPKGGFLLWLELPEKFEAWDIYRKALRKGISVAPGPLFTASGKGMSNHIRLHGGLPMNERNLQALKDLSRLF